MTQQEILKNGQWNLIKLIFELTEGGDYGNAGFSAPMSNCSYGYPYSSANYVGFRPTLFLKG